MNRSSYFSDPDFLSYAFFFLLDVFYFYFFYENMHFVHKPLFSNLNAPVLVNDLTRRQARHSEV